MSTEHILNAVLVIENAKLLVATATLRKSHALILLIVIPISFAIKIPQYANTLTNQMRHALVATNVIWV